MMLFELRLAIDHKAAEVPVVVAGSLKGAARGARWRPRHDVFWLHSVPDIIYTEACFVACQSSLEAQFGYHIQKPNLNDNDFFSNRTPSNYVAKHYINIVAGSPVVSRDLAH